MIVSTTAQLLAAIKVAAAGTVISLAPGNYTGVKILSVTNPGAPIVINSSDPTHPAIILSSFGLANSSGLTFSDLEFSSIGASDPYYAFRIQNVQNVAFQGLNVHGDPAGVAAAQIDHFYVIKSTNIAFTGSTFRQGAIVANNNTGVNISGNTFSQENKGGVEMGGCSNVTIAKNKFTDFQVSPGTHADAIQLYTAGTTVQAHDIAITGNVFDRGDGNVAQGIFVQDEVGTLPYLNLTIDGNAVLGGMWDSIYVSGAAGALRVTNNVAVTWPGLDMEGNGTASAALTAPAVTNFTAWIWLRGNLSGATITETGNAAQAFMGPAAQVPAPVGNVVTPAMVVTP